ncbi:MAG TPA: ABC transporter ATP-binding protein [Limnochordales bacterium]
MEIHYILRRPVKLEARLEVRGFTVLLGRSGSGKTSLLKAIAGLLAAEGRPYGGLPPEKRPVGYLPQHYALFPHLRVWENVAFPLQGSRQGRRRQALELLERLGVAHLAERRPAELSGGQQQRVALARALARKPELLLLDEPTSALDPSTREAVMAQLVSLARDTGTPVLAASHDPAVARMADRVAVLAEGKVVQQGTPDEVFGRPASPEVARLVGVENLLAARVAAAQGELALLETPVGPLWARRPGPRTEQAARVPPLAEGSAAVVALHSRDLVLEPAGAALSGTLPAQGASGTADPPNRLPGVVEAVWPCGPEVRVQVRIGVPGCRHRPSSPAAGSALQAVVPRHVAAQVGVRSGQAVWVLVAPELVHVMPADETAGGAGAEYALAGGRALPGSGRAVAAGAGPRR